MHFNKRFTRGKGLLENFLSKKRANIADSLIPDNLRNGKILDIGCGKFPFFLTKIKFKEKHGIDSFILNKKHKSITLHKINIEKKPLPYKNEFFNVITLLAVIEHFKKENLYKIFKEINRVLKKDGILIITTPTPLGNTLLKSLSIISLVSKEEIKEHSGGFNKFNIKNYLKKSNFHYQEFKHRLFEFGLNNWFYIKK